MRQHNNKATATTKLQTTASDNNNNNIVLRMEELLILRLPPRLAARLNARVTRQERTRGEGFSFRRRRKNQKGGKTEKDGAQVVIDAVWGEDGAPDYDSTDDATDLLDLEDEGPQSEEEGENGKKKLNDEDEEDSGQTTADKDAYVYLGIPGKPDPGDPFWAKIGEDPSQSWCQHCKSQDYLLNLVTVSAPFADFKTRFLYVQFCQSCSKFQVFRAQSLTNSLENPTTTIAKSQPPLWNEETTGFGETTSDDLEELFAQIETSLGNSKKKKASQSKPENHSRKNIWLRMIDEPCLEEQDYSRELELLEKYNKEAQVNGEETFRAFIQNEETTQEDFFERLSRNNAQRIRYSYKNSPIFPHQFKAFVDNVPPANCEACGKPRYFEFQVTPQTVYDIEKLYNVAIDFSSILVYTCEESCSGSSFEFCTIIPGI